MPNSFSYTSLPPSLLHLKASHFLQHHRHQRKQSKELLYLKKTLFIMQSSLTILYSNPSKTIRPIKFPTKDSRLSPKTTFGSLLLLLPNMKVIIIFLIISFFPLPFVLHRGLANYTLRAKSCLPLLYVNKVLLKYSHVHYLE